MIVPMSKYSMLLYHQDKDRFMEKLMDLGLVHIHGYVTEEDTETEMLALNIREIEEAIRRFKRRKVNVNGEAPVDTSAFPPLEEIADMERALEHAVHETEALAIEIKLLEPWGEFDRHALKKLEQRTGLEVKFFQYPENRFNPQWKQDFALEIINTIKGIVYFIIFRRPGEELPLSPVALPSASLSALKQERQRYLLMLDSLNAKLDECAANLSNGLHYKLAEAKDQLSLHIAKQKAKGAAEKTLWIVEAWCPQSAEKKLNEFLDSERIVFVRGAAPPDETPPVLLKNNWFTRLFEPIGALFSLPRYSELDLTVFFAPFFLLFFGLCLGDVGYGIVILIIASALKLKFKSKYYSYLTLGQLFGIATILAGVISGTLFGLEMAHHEAFRSWSNLFLNQDQLFNLALIIGFVQILFGMGIQVYKQWTFRGFRFALSRIGWMILLICLGDLYVVKVINPISSILIWPGLALIIFFGAPEKGWLKSFGFGLADLYNITGVLGDLLSYIRLFALGVSSAILGLVVNNMALSARDVPYAGFLLFVVVLVVGHTANLLLSSLSAFVHPMRLTFVEFYKNTGFEGGGKPFTPFAKTKNDS
jgi:V/A-type H+/Na+-transporting ATPase subunit I